MNYEKPHKEIIYSDNSMFPVKVFTVDTSHDVSPHFHDWVEILYLVDGESAIWLNEQKQQLKKGSVCLIGSCVTHSIKNKSAKFLVIQFMPWLINGGICGAVESRYIIPFLSFKGTLGLEDGQDAIRDIVLKISDEFFGGKRGYEIYIKGYIYLLAANLMRAGVIREGMAVGEFMELDKLLKYIENNINLDISMKKAAQQYRMSYFHFSRKFKALTGYGFKQYIDFVRVCEAEKLIYEKGFTAAQAAIETGYTNISSFHRAFKRIRGYTPGTIKKITKEGI